jgi:hypothetical protein
MSCSSLTSVTIGNGVTSIDHSAFSTCSSLTAFTVNSGNTAFSSQDGVLFNANKTTLVAYPGGKSGAYTIPNSVTAIGDSAFAYCSDLTAVTIPNSVTSIGPFAFIGCSSLSSVNVLRDTLPLTELSYSLGNGGSASQWFDGTHASLVIYVPAGKVSEYTSMSGWSEYASRILAAP